MWVCGGCRGVVRGGARGVWAGRAVQAGRWGRGRRGGEGRGYRPGRPPSQRLPGGVYPRRLYLPEPFQRSSGPAAPATGGWV